MGGSSLTFEPDPCPPIPVGHYNHPMLYPPSPLAHTDTGGIFLDFIRPELRLMEPPAGRSTSLGCGVCAANNNMAVSRGSLVVFVWTSLSDAGVTGLASDD